MKDDKRSSGTTATKNDKPMVTYVLRMRNALQRNTSKQYSNMSMTIRCPAIYEVGPTEVSIDGIEKESRHNNKKLNQFSSNITV